MKIKAEEKMKIRLAKQNKKDELKMMLKKVDKKHTGRPRKWPLYWYYQGRDMAQDPSSEYHFLIVNTDKREIENIKGIIHGRIAFGSFHIVKQLDGKINDLYWEYLHMDTHNQKIIIPQLRVAYNGKTEKDIRLYERSRLGYEKLEDYVIGKLKRKTE